MNDPDGSSDTDSVQIQAGNTPPTAQIDAPAATFNWAVGEEIDFSGSASDAQETLPASAYGWSATINHCPSNCHTHPYQSFTGVTGGSFPGPDHDYPSSVTITLTVTDGGGLSDTDSVTIDPRTVQLTLDSTPEGVQIGIDQDIAVTPFTEMVIEGSAHSVIAPAQASMGGQTYDFDSWSDGGAIAHNLTAAADLQLDARYTTSALGAPPVLGQSGVGAICAGTDATIVGTERADRLVGTAGPDVIAGLGGKDTLIGKGGDDLICGGRGADVLRGGVGADLLKGGPGADLLKGGPGRDRCPRRQRSDRVSGCERGRGR